jgi:FkbM family methyltransferase
MIERVFDVYARLFARRRFYRLNKGLFLMSLRGLGILNYRDETASGEYHFLRKHLQGVPRPVVFDVGANKGDYSAAILAANMNAQVYAFEPHPGTFQRLSARMAPHGARVVNAACGRAAGQMELYDYVDSGSAHASLYKGVIEEIHGQHSRAHTVDVIDIDSFVTNHGIEHVDLLKIDTEGHELEVLRGAARTLNEGKVAAIQFEFNEMNLISRTFLRDFFDILPNFRFHRMVRDGLVPLSEAPPLYCEIFAFQNIVCLLHSPNQ